MKVKYIKKSYIVTVSILFSFLLFTSCSSDLDKAKKSAIKTLECLEVVLSDSAPQDIKEDCIKHNENQKAIEDNLSPEDKEAIARFYVEKFKEMQEDRN